MDSNAGVLGALDRALWQCQRHVAIKLFSDGCVEEGVMFKKSAA